MVAKIKTPQKLATALNYNEQKVAQGAAKLLWTSGYLKADNFYEKLEGMDRLTRLNNAKTNGLHISLNFPIEEHLDRNKLIAIADNYMEQIGFGAQPYLVYQHFDAAHPHLHILTCSIRSDGSRIDTWKIGERLSEPARKNIEETYGLIKAGERERREAFRLKPVNAEQVKYGKSPTKRAITNVLDVVLARYHFRSLPELNAILAQYNVEAALVGEKGLVYRVIGSGVAVRASDIYNKPTRSFLERRYALNDAPKNTEKATLRLAIDTVLKDNLTWPQIQAALRGQGIAVVERRSDGGKLYGLTFVDHRTRCVFNGSDLGKAYTALNLVGRCRQVEALEQIPELKLGLLDNESSEQMDWQLKNTRKKRRKQKPE